MPEPWDSSHRWESRLYSAFSPSQPNSWAAWVLIVGFLSRIAAFGILCNMLVAVYLVHIHVGFFMNWTGAQKGEGYEYHLLAAVVALTLIDLWRGGVFGGCGVSGGSGRA